MVLECPDGTCIPLYAGVFSGAYFSIIAKVSACCSRGTILDPGIRSATCGLFSAVTRRFTPVHIDVSLFVHDLRDSLPVSGIAPTSERRNSATSTSDSKQKICPHDYQAYSSDLFPPCSAPRKFWECFLCRKPGFPDPSGLFPSPLFNIEGVQIGVRNKPEE